MRNETLRLGGPCKTLAIYALCETAGLALDLLKQSLRLIRSSPCMYARQRCFSGTARGPWRILTRTKPLRGRKLVRELYGTSSLALFFVLTGCLKFLRGLIEL